MATQDASTASSDALAEVEVSASYVGTSFPVGGDEPKVNFKVSPRNRAKKKLPVGKGGGELISLPIPANLSTGYGMAYDTGSGVGVMGKVAMDAARNTGTGDISSAVEAVGGALGSTDAIKQQALSILGSTAPDVMMAIGAGLGGAMGLGGFGVGAAVGNALGGGAQGALAGAGIAVNPHLAVLFTGPRFRTHQFSYKLSPRSAGESSALFYIIKSFKKAMAPKIDGLAFFDYPDEFIISFPKNESFLFKIGTSVLTDFTVNYTPDGGSYFHENGAPVSVSMSLSFTELDVITKDKIAQGR